MNMDNQAMPKEAPIAAAPQPEPNFIDLTEGNTNTQVAMNQNLASPIIDNNMPLPQNDMPVSQPMPQQPANTTPIDYAQNSDNTINIDALTSNYNSVPEYNQPAQEVASEVQNYINDEPKFDMSQSMNPNPMMSPDIGLNVNANVVDPNPIQDSVQYNPTIDMNENNVVQSEMPNVDYPSQQISEITPPIMDNNIMDTPQNTYIPEQPLAENPIEQPTEKIENDNLTPVVNTIKTLADNLNSLGYIINTTEEDTPTSKKIIIEINK